MNSLSISPYVIDAQGRIDYIRTKEVELFGAPIRIHWMGKRTNVSIVHRRALNQTMLYAGRAPIQARHEPQVFIRALRSALRMSQARLAHRCGVPQAHIARLESGKLDIRLSTLRRLFDAMFCDLLIVPRPRKRPGDALAEQELERPRLRAAWD